MRKYLILFIVIVLLGCSDKHKEINSLIESEKYQQAITLITNKLEKKPNDDVLTSLLIKSYKLLIEYYIDIDDFERAENILNEQINIYPKNIAFRKLLILCYENRQLWEKMLNQINISKNIDKSVNFDFEMLKAYGALKRNDEFVDLYKKYENYLDSLNIEFENKIVKFTNSLTIQPDSLENIESWIENTNVDTLEGWEIEFNTEINERFNNNAVNEKKYFYYVKTNSDSITILRKKFLKENKIDDWYYISILNEFNDKYIHIKSISDLFDELNNYTNKYNSIIRNFVKLYHNTIEKPSPYNPIYTYSKDSSKLFYYEMRAYYNELTIANMILGDNEEAISNKLSEIFTIEQSNDFNVYFDLACFDYLELIKANNYEDDKIKKFINEKINHLDKDYFVYQKFKEELHRIQ